MQDSDKQVFIEAYHRARWGEWATEVLQGHEDIGHVHLTITDTKGHKHHYMQGSEGWGGLTGDGGSVIIERDRMPTPQESRRDYALQKLGMDFTGQYRYQPISTEIFAFPTRGAKEAGDVACPASLGRDHSGQYRDGEPER